jgi:hypothetical protein
VNTESPAENCIATLKSSLFMYQAMVDSRCSAASVIPMWSWLKLSVMRTVKHWSGLRTRCQFDLGLAVLRRRLSPWPTVGSYILRATSELIISPRQDKLLPNQLVRRPRLKRIARSGGQTAPVVVQHYLAMSEDRYWIFDRYLTPMMYSSAMAPSRHFATVTKCTPPSANEMTQVHSPSSILTGCSRTLYSGVEFW